MVYAIAAEQGTNQLAHFTETLGSSSMRISVSGERDARGSSVTSARPDCTGSVAQCNGNSARPGPRLSPGAATQMIACGLPRLSIPRCKDHLNEQWGSAYPPVNPKAGRSALGQPGHRTENVDCSPRRGTSSPTPCDSPLHPGGPTARIARTGAALGKAPRGYCCWQRRFFARSQDGGHGDRESRSSPSWRGHSNSVIPVLSV